MSRKSCIARVVGVIHTRTCGATVFALACCAAMAQAAPVVLFTDVVTGPRTGGPGNFGAPISIFGTGFGATRGNSTVTIGGIEVASYLVWGAGNAHNPALDMIVVQPGSSVTGGPIVVTVGGIASNADQSFTPNSGQIYYISTAGSDSNNGSEAAPFATIQYAGYDAVTNPGDIILLRGGSYPENEIWLRDEYGDGGAAGQQKVIKNYPGEEVFLTNGARGFLLDASYLTVSGLNFRGGKTIGMYDSATGLDFRVGARLINNTVIGDIDYDGIGTHGHHHLIAGNVVEVSVSTQGTQGHCFYISVGMDLRLMYNVASGAPGYGIHLFDQYRGGPGHETDYQRVIRDVIIEGNILKNSTRRSGLLIAMGDEAAYGNYVENVLVRNNIFMGNNHDGVVLRGITRNVRIYHNTFHQNGKQSLSLEYPQAIDNVDIRNNLFFQSPNDFCTYECGFPDAHAQIGPAATNVSLSHNGYFPGPPVVIGATDPNPVTGSVAFANPATFDFRVLAGGSPIDAGVPLADSARDYLGTPRPQGSAPDIGAFEFMSQCSAVVQPPARSMCPGGSAAFTVTPSLSGPFTYLWQIEDPPGTWNTFGNDPAPLPGGGAAYAAPLNSPVVTIGVIGRTGPFGVRSVVTGSCGVSNSNVAILTICDRAADVNCDGRVELADLATLLTNFGTAGGASHAQGDLNGDGAVNLTDLAILLGVFGQSCP